VSPATSAPRSGSAGGCPPACSRESLETGLVHPPAWAAGRHVHFTPASPVQSPYAQSVTPGRGGAAGSLALRQGLAAAEGEAEPIIGPQPLLYSEHGTVQHNVTLHLILWGKNFKPVSEGGTKTGEEVRKILEELYKGLSNSAYQGILTQYFDPTSRVGPELVFPAPYVDESEPAPASVEGSKVEQEVVKAIEANKANGWASEPNAQFVVAPAPGTTLAGGFMNGICAYHGFMSGGQVYDFVPYTGDVPNGCDEDVQGNPVHATSKFASHEYSEAATDPRVGCGEGWRTGEYGCGGEIGDMCNGNGDREVPGTHAWAQGEYDDHLGGCAYSDLSPPHVLGLTEPPSNLGRHEATLNATVNAENEGLDTKYLFEYGPTTAYGKSVPAAGNVDVGHELGNQQVHQTLTGLQLEATVHYRVAATHINKEGKNETTYGLDHTVIPSQWSTGQVPLPSASGIGSFGTTPLASCRLGSCGGVSCASAESCVAVGSREDLNSSTEPGFAERWNGSRWSFESLPTPTLPYVGMTGVSCASTSACMAVGEGPTNPGAPQELKSVADSWEMGKGWSITPVELPNGAKEGGLLAVSCSSSTECVAVGTTFNGEGHLQPYATLWKSGSWTVKSVPNPPEGVNTVLQGVSCPSARSCMAVGFSDSSSHGRTAVIESWNGSEWSLGSAKIPPETSGFPNGPNLFGVSCTSPGACTAVGWYENASHRGSLIERWDGKQWSIQAPANAALNQELTGVSCVSAKTCTATGAYVDNRGIWVAMVQTWNGVGWSVEPLNRDETNVDLASELHAVSCAQSNCAAVGVLGSSSYFHSVTHPVEAGPVARPLAEIRSTLKPTVASIEPPSSKLEGTEVTIHGSNFVAPATVTIGNAATAVQVVSETEIKAKTTATAPGAYEVVVSDANGTSSGGPTYTYSATVATYLSSFPSAGFGSLGTQGVAVDASGNVWVSDAVNHRVNEFSSQGAFKLAFGFGVKDEKKELETCTEKCLVGLTGSEPGEFGAPGAYGLSIGGIAVSGADIWVVDGGNARIEEFTTSPSGEIKTERQIGTLSGPEGIVTDSSGNNVWVSSYGFGALQEFSTTTGGLEQQVLTYENLSGLAVDAQGNVWAAVSPTGPTGFARVDEYSPLGAFKLAFGWHVNKNGAEKLETCTSECLNGTAGGGEGQFYQPHGVVVDGHGDVFVADSGNNRVQEFFATGKYITQFGSSGSGAGQFSDPLGIAVAGGQAYAVDAGNNRVEKWEVWENLPPVVVTGAASSITATTATLNATVNPNGSEVSACKLEYGITTSYGSSAPCTPSPGSGESPVAVSASVTGLTSGTTYHFRVSATNAGGTSQGSDQTFNTP
jgi:sugar lactone lactonase YvrE